MDILSLLPKLPETGAIADILMWVLALNLFLSGLGKALEKIKDHTKSKADNKAYEVISKVTGVLQKIVDLISANRAHK